MSRNRKRNDHPFDDSIERAENPEQPMDRKRRRWPWVLLLLVVGLFFLPNLLAMTSLKQTAIDYALADFRGKVTVGSASLGWLQPVRLTDLKGVDANNQPLFQINEVKTSRSLLSFLTSSDYGQLDIDQPIVWLQLHPTGSNLEDAAAAWLPPTETAAANSDADKVTEAIDNSVSSETKLPKLTLNVVNGAAIITNSDGVTIDPQSWQIDQLNLQATSSASVAALTAETSCRVTTFIADATGQSQASTSGGLSATVQVDPGSTLLTGNSIVASLNTDGFPVAMAGPLMQRWVGPANTAGTFKGQLQAAFDAATQNVNLLIDQAEIANFSIAAPSILGSDRIEINQLTAQGNLTANPSLIMADNFRVQSELGQLSANGQFDVNQLASVTNQPNLLGTPFQMDGEIDLAKVAAMLPATLQLQDGLEVQSGTIKFQAGSRVEDQTRRLTVNMDTANISAKQGSKTIVWQKPLRLVGTISDSNGTMSLEEIRCESDFLTIAGSATYESGSFSANGNLDQLVERVSQFIDLAGLHLSGDVVGKLAWQMADATRSTPPNISLQNRPIQLVGEFKIDHPAIQLPDMPIWRQPQLTVRMSAEGQSTSDQRLQLDQGGVQIDIGNEQVIATLAQPVSDAFKQGNWQLDCQLSGSTDGWLAHVQNFVDLGELSAAGQIQAQAMANVSPQAIELNNTRYAIEALSFDGYGLTIREQQTEGTANLRYDLTSGQTLISDATLSSNSISAGGQQITIDVADNIQINGDVAFRADVNRVADWLSMSPTKESVFWFGNGEGTIAFVSDENGIGARITATIQDMIAATRQPAGSNRVALNGDSAMRPVSDARQWTELWREAKVGLNGDISLANDFDSITFAQTSIDSTTLKATVDGQLSDLGGAMVADVRGQWTPDWQQLNALVAAYSGDMVQFAGQGSYPIALRGPLFETSIASNQPAPWVSPLLNAAAGFGWEQASVAGLPIGASTVEISLEQGVATVTTGDIPFSDGVISLRPQIDLRGTEPVLYLPQGKMIDQVALTPETARQWLSYIAPLAADATSAKGRFSVTAEGAEVPLMDPLAMRAKGTLTLSNVVIGAGPTAEKLLSTAKQLRAILDPGSASRDRDLNTWLTLEEQSIPIAVENGRVFHEGLKISHKDIIIRTSGSVGLDQTLEMVAEIPIADKWIAGKKEFASLKGQTISIPIRGTASNPKLDSSALKQLSTQLVQEAAGNAVNKFIGEKISPELNQFQEKLSGQVNEQVNRLQSKLQSKLGGQSGDQPQEPIEDKLQNELLKGFGKLFGK